MQSSHTFTVDSAVFDERNLVSAAGLVPVLELAEQTGLSELIAEHVQLPSTRVRSGAVNPAGKPWSMPDLSRAIGVSARTLQDGFQRYVGVSPTCYLREVRLQRARADLSNPALCTTVSDTAYRWGFAHLGRFAVPIATSSASRPRRHCTSRHRKNFHHGRGNTCRAGRSFCHCDVLGLSVRSNGAETAGWWSAQYSPPARYSDTSRISLSPSPTPSAVSIPGTHSDSPMCWSRAASSAR